MTRGLRHQLCCTVCNTLFAACRSDTLYCGSACSQRAARQRRNTMRLSPAQVEPVIAGGIEQRIWQGTDIQRRSRDGWINATAMCKANGREWFTYARSSRTQEYIEALKAAPQICGTEVVQSVTGGTPALQGTWVHPRLAVDLARWISPAFAVWMDGWFLESLQGFAPQVPPGTYMLAPGITIMAKTPEDAKFIWYDAVWRAVTKGTTQDLFRFAEG